MSVTTSFQETVLVAQSDDHLAAVEEAKRTGKPFESKGAKGSNVVPLEVATAIAEAKALENTYVGPFGLTHAAHLQGFHEAVRSSPDYVPLSNEEKARQHAEYSAELVRARQAQEAGMQALIAEGYDPSIAVQEANFQRANAHAEYSAKYEKNRQERDAEATPVLNMVDESVKLINGLEANTPMSEVVKEMTKLSSVVVPKALEEETQDALILKDRIISVEEQYEDHVASPEESLALDNPGVVVLASAGSPEELEEETLDAQFAANRITEIPETEEEQAKRAEEQAAEENKDKAEE